MKNNVAKDWEKSFREHKGCYSPVFFNKKFYRLFTNSKSFRRIKKILDKKGSKILEAGCGSGKLSVCLGLEGHSVTALDYSNEMLNNCQKLKNHAQKLFRKRINVNTQQGDIQNLPFENESFDMVVNEGVVEHWLERDERIEVIRELARVTKKGGKLIIIVPNGGHPYHEKWMKLKLPSYFSAPPMTRYNTNKLAREMREVGLRIVYSDGLGAIRSLNYWPKKRILNGIVEFLNLIVPLPRNIRKRWGINIILVGEK